MRLNNIYLINLFAKKNHQISLVVINQIKLIGYPEPIRWK